MFSDSVIENFYEALASDDTNALKKIHIPRSDVFYVREALYHRTGQKFSLWEVERAMWLEGWLEEKDIDISHLEGKEVPGN